MTLSWAIAFFILAIITAVLGFGGIFAEAVGAGFRMAFFVFILGFVVALLVAVFVPFHRRPR